MQTSHITSSTLWSRLNTTFKIHNPFYPIIQYFSNTTIPYQPITAALATLYQFCTQYMTSSSLSFNFTMHTNHSHISHDLVSFHFFLSFSWCQALNFFTAILIISVENKYLQSHSLQPLWITKQLLYYIRVCSMCEITIIQLVLNSLY